ncbi:hypothetical protein DFJ58DRAFT_732687 [Suillus subalutaceus]|uniref:uncharacterized protein n=1 Tax=Suillus subalutaceus TaxID=48586 RepID=UPI001B87280C|nr:uncharacterized protein DFJ58DRAFT_732687 [Suillus subalutaceus]KAG1840938.1 hypothetical protein DFJ58DRAFT_732687 [Suillus subalutaceus]
MAEAEAGNVTTSGKHVALGRKFSNQLLNDESEDVKVEVRRKYEEQLTCKKGTKHGKSIPDDEDGNEEMDAEVHNHAVHLIQFYLLVKQKTRFVVSFMFAGPDPRNDWDMTTLLCHPSETPQGNTFSELYETADHDFLAAFQQYTEQIFSGNKCKPDLNAWKEDDSGETGDPDEEESEKYKNSSDVEGDDGDEDAEGDEDVEEDDGDEAGEEDESDAQSTDMEEDKGEGNQSVGVVESAVASIMTTNASFGATESLSAGELTSVTHASMETIAPSYGLQNHAVYYGMQPQALYDSQAQSKSMYGIQAHTTYGAQAYPTYGLQGPTYNAQGTSHASFAGMYPSFVTGPDASLQSQGPAFPMQMSTYTDFGICPSNLFMPGIITPESSLNEGFQIPDWNNPPWNGNNPAWNFDGVEGTPRDEDSHPILPSPNPILSADDTSLPSIEKAGTTTSRKVKISRKAAKKGDGQKRDNTKSMVGKAAAKSSAESASQHTTKTKKPPAAKSSPGQAKPSTETVTQSSSTQRTNENQ